MTENLKKLLETIIETIKGNPELPVVCMVDGQICGDDSRRWLGSIGRCYVGRYIVDEDRVWLEDDFEKFVEKYCDNNDFDLPKDPTESERIIDQHAQDGIIVNIDLHS